MADFTYVWTAEGWLYVAVVIDIFSRRVVGWSMSATIAAQLVTDALAMAIWRRGRPRALLHHSDRGSPYSSESFQRLMADHGVTCSMSRLGNVWDNAAMESFFSSLRTERLARKTYRTRDAARAEVVFDYIERFYNPTRRHSAISALWRSSAWPVQAKLDVHRTGSRPPWECLEIVKASADDLGRSAEALTDLFVERGRREHIRFDNLYEGNSVACRTTRSAIDHWHQQRCCTSRQAPPTLPLWQGLTAGPDTGKYLITRGAPIRGRSYP